MNNRSTRNKLNLRAIIVLLAVLILAFMFVFNLFKSNRNAKIAKEKVKANVTKVSKFNFSTVVDVEAELQKMKEAENGGSEDGKNYRTIFANCAIVGDSITEVSPFMVSLVKSKFSLLSVVQLAKMRQCLIKPLQPTLRLLSSRTE